MSYDDTNKGAVWKNETENPKAPVLKGATLTEPFTS